MSAIGRFQAYMAGHRMVRLSASPREGGYIFVNSPDLPGFSVMLQPGELDDFESLVAALGKPLEAFVNAEYHAAQAHASKVARDGSQVRLKGMQYRSKSEITADLCAQPA
jgi:hypothetical protein